MNNEKSPGNSYWRVVKPIPGPHPEMDPIPYGTLVKGQTRLDSEIVIIERVEPSSNFYHTNSTYICKSAARKYLEVKGANIRYKPEEEKA